MEEGFKVREKIEVGKIYESKSYGKFKVLEYRSSSNVLIRFELTGYTCISDSSTIRKGFIKDRMKPTLNGVGFVGDGKYNSKDNKWAYHSWRKIIISCYGDTGNESATMDLEWLNFQVFARWYENNKIDGCRVYVDSFFTGSKHYSKETCSFKSNTDSAALKRSKIHKFKDNLNRVIFIDNLTKFCKENKLSYSCMYRVHTGDRKHHKGWTKA